MANITLQEVERLAVLARLDLTQEQKESLVKDMENIIGMISELDAVDVSDISSGMETDFPHISKKSDPRPGVVSTKNPEDYLKNVQHPLQDGGIVVKSSLG